MPVESSPVEIFKEKCQLFAATAKPIEFPLRDDEYTVSSYAKTGTSWVQQIVHQLRTGGDENFQEISFAVPMLMAGVPLDKLLTDSGYHPRVFKTHYNYEDIAPQGGKHIYVLRNPEDTLWSYFKFAPRVCCIRGLSVEDFYFSFFRDFPNPNYWWNILSWWPHRHESDKVIFVHYEDLKENREHCIRHIAKFLKVPVSDQLLHLVLERSSFEYMKANSHLFDARYEAEKFRKILGITSNEKYPEKVREDGGEVGQGKKNVPQNITDDMKKVWEERITLSTGCKNYDELRAETSLLNKPL